MKSHESDCLEVALRVYQDACARCSVKPSWRDQKTIRSRVQSQGISFLTITLPNFCADFERSLDKGLIDPSFFQYFRKSGVIPAFLQGLLGLVFEKRTGRIIYDETSKAGLISSIRQICLTFKKIRLPCTPARERNAIEAFVKIEHSFNCLPLPEEDSRVFERVSSMLWGNILYGLRPMEFTPKHGPGRTADYISGNRKYSWTYWHDRLEPYFPLLGSALPISCGSLHPSEELERVSIVSSSQERPVRVVSVPKTLKAPRIIALEPCCMQYTQQGVSEALVERLESHPVTRGHINFRDQAVNQRLAVRSSIDGRYSTIDLSDASDRVPVGYALEMFTTNPDLKDCIEACRSTRAQLPDGRIIPLRKFASMGSALCFPIEAMYFYTICVVASLRAHNLSITHANIYKCSRDIYVYGDDLVVPADVTESVLEHLRKYNCRVNERKTFSTGKFRESCGVDAYNGEVVTPTYIRELRPENRRQASRIISWVSTANQFFKKGFVRTSLYLFYRVEQLIGSLPTVGENSPMLGRHHDWYNVPRSRWNRKIQSKEILGWVQSPVYRTDKLEGVYAMSKSLLSLERRKSIGLAQISEPLLFDKSALHGEVALNRRWVPAV